MKKNVWMALGVILAVLLAAIAIVSKVKGGCTAMIECTNGQVPMKCHWTYIATTYIGIAGALVALAGAFQSGAGARRMAVVSAAIVAVVAMVVVSPMGIGTCAHAESMCNGTATIVYALAIIAVILAVVMAVKADAEEAAKPKMHL